VTVAFKAPGTCTDSAPGSAPKLASAVANGTSQITLTWTAATNPVTYYLLAYGLTSGQYIYGNPNIGGHDTTSYTVSNLAKGTTYYFVVKAVNICNPSNFSNEISATTAGGAVVTPVTPNTSSTNTDQNNITTPTNTPTPTPEVQLTTTPTPTLMQTRTAGISKTTMLIYILIFIAVVGGGGNFIYWRHKKNVEKSAEIFEEEKNSNLS
jgi:hypothetical protein